MPPVCPVAHLGWCTGFMGCSCCVCPAVSLCCAVPCPCLALSVCPGGCVGGRACGLCVARGLRLGVRLVVCSLCGSLWTLLGAGALIRAAEVQRPRLTPP